MESGQSQFAPLKLRSLALVPSSGARCAPPNSTSGSSTARLFPPRQGAPVTDSRPFRAPASQAEMRLLSSRRDGVSWLQTDCGISSMIQAISPHIHRLSTLYDGSCHRSLQQEAILLQHAGRCRMLWENVSNNLM